MATITLTTDPPVDPQTPTPTHYQQLAAEIQAAIDTIATLLPKLEESLTADTRQARRNLNVPDAFCHTAVNAVEQLPEINAAKKLNVDKCRNQLQFIEAFRPVYDKFEAVSRRLRHALWSNKASAATASLQVLRVAKAYASDNRSPAVAAHVAAMQRDLARKTRMTKAELAERKLQKLKQASEQPPEGKEVQPTIV